MGYSKEVYTAVSNRLAQRRSQAELELEKRKEALYPEIPQLAQIEKELAGAGIEVAKVILAHKVNTNVAVERLKTRNLTLQDERRQILESVGLPADYLEIPYHCPLCRDTGYVGQKRCSCMEQELRQEAARQFNAASGMQLCTFENFSLGYYAKQPDAEVHLVPYEQMQYILTYCKHYAEDFSLQSPHLYFYGRTGLGKTHLSLAIADRVIQKGFSAIYGSVQTFLSRMEQEKFGRSAENGDTLQTLLDCDLLILDDLGSEFISSFSISALYHLINSRLNLGRPMIINSNLSSSEMQNLYSERIVSRIFGFFETFRLIGSDIRALKK